MLSPTNSKPYYSLIVKYEKGNLWSIAFGDYKKAVVMQEREDAYQDCHKTRIICTMSNQEAIDSEVARLNEK